MAMDYFMKMAFNIAKTADIKLVRPNPLVGAVVVSKDGNIIGKGYHEKFGQAHAEINAINNALNQQADLSDCTLYVTMEPCSHQGKTPPCTEYIKKHKIPKVIIGTTDPNPQVDGINILRASGIIVEEHNYNELIELNREFFVNQQLNRPYVALKMAMTMNGKIADRNGNSKWLSNEMSRNYVHEKLRPTADAILSTFHTIKKDDSQLNIRKKDGSTYDKNIIVIDRDLKLLDSENAGLSIFLAHPRSFIYLFGTKKKIKKIPHNVKVIFTDFDTDGNINLEALLKIQLELHHYNILVEGGSKLATQLMLHELIDEIHLFIGPKIIIDSEAIDIFKSNQNFDISNAKEFKLSEINNFNSDVFLTYKRKISLNDF